MVEKSVVASLKFYFASSHLSLRLSLRDGLLPGKTKINRNLRVPHRRRRDRERERERARRRTEKLIIIIFSSEVSASFYSTLLYHLGRLLRCFLSFFSSFSPIFPDLPRMRLAYRICRPRWASLLRPGGGGGGGEGRGAPLLWFRSPSFPHLLANRRKKKSYTRNRRKEISKRNPRFFLFSSAVSHITLRIRRSAASSLLLSSPFDDEREGKEGGSQRCMKFGSERERES